VVYDRAHTLLIGGLTRQHIPPLAGGMFSSPKGGGGLFFKKTPRADNNFVGTPLFAPPPKLWGAIFPLPQKWGVPPIDTGFFILGGQIPPTGKKFPAIFGQTPRKGFPGTPFPIKILALPRGLINLGFCSPL